MATHAVDPLIGRAFGEFVLEERIGEGGFGAVYRARQRALDREAVIKVLHTRLHASESATERFLREAKLASKLDHPYAAHIYAFGAEPDGELWIAMEFVRGTPLDQVLRAQGTMPLERLVPLLDRMCEVVHTAHEQGIVHRDIKPPNVMVLARAGRLLPKLLDFGIAKGLTVGGASADDDGIGDSDTMAAAAAAIAKSAMLDATIEATPTPIPMPAPVVVGGTPPPATLRNTGDGLELTQRGAIMGSPMYMAPEQWVDAGLVDGRSDLYALAILAYECLTGQPPFRGSSIMEIAAGHAKKTAAPLGPKFPVALEAFFAKALAKRPDDRYPDALAFAAALRDASGIAAAAPNLPSIDAAVRDAAVTTAPRPIAEAVAAIDAARNAHQARDGIVQLARTIARYLGLAALACRSRFATTGESPAVAAALRTLYQRPLTDVEWIALARELTTPWRARRDAYPIPELVDLCADRRALADLAALAALRDRDLALTTTADGLVGTLESAVATASSVLAAISFLADYPLVVPRAGGVAERWAGVRRAQPPPAALAGKELPAGLPVLLDSDGAPVLSLAPLFQVVAPSPGAADELFLFDGRDARGAKLIALPTGFEHHDDALWDWFRAQLAETLDDSGAAVGEERAPYRGLSTFSPEDGGTFFGREKLVDAVVNRLKLQSLLVVVGRSGAGKSSFVYAGVVPALGSRVIALRPGASPIAALVARLEHAGLGKHDKAALARDRDALGEVLRADAASRGPVVLVIDQLEEVFTMCQDAGERDAFVAALAAAARSPDDPVRVIFTLRDDFLVRAEQVPALRDRIGQCLQLVSVPAPDDLRRIVVEPARRAGYELEGDLADDMVREVADQPGALALISFTARELWELRDRHFKQLTRAAYTTLGGVGGALARHADVTLDDMPVEERALAREAFRHLVTSQGTRAVLARNDVRVLLGGGAHADRVLERLVSARLLVASENEDGDETIEIVHEALLVAWPRLVEWRRDDAEGARLREQLRAAAEQWHERGRVRGLLWRGDALAEYARWRARHPGPLTDLEAAFTDASIAAEARGRRNLRLALAAAFAVLVAGVIGLVVFNTRIAGERAAAQSAADELHAHLQTQYEDQGRRLVLAGDPWQGLAYLFKAQELGERGPAHDFLVAEAVRATDGEIVAVRHEHAVRSPHFTHDGTKIVTASYDKRVRMWDAQTGALVRELVHDQPVYTASVAPDDRTILSGGASGTATLWDASSGTKLAAFTHGHAAVRCALYTPDGRTAVVAGHDEVIDVIDVATASSRRQLRDPGKDARECALSRDGRLLVVGDSAGTARVWQLEDGKLVREIHAASSVIRGVDLAGDGRMLLVAAGSAAVIVELESGRIVHHLEHEGTVRGARWSADGHTAITASEDRTAAIWDAETGKRRLTLGGHSSTVNAARFSPDDRQVVTVSGDGATTVWDPVDGRMVARWRGHRDAIYDAPDFDAAGTRIVTASDDGTAIVSRLSAHDNVHWLVRDAAAIFDARFAPDGRRVAIAGAATLEVRDAVTGGLDHALQFSAVRAVWSHDGRWLAGGGTDGRVHLWDGQSDTERIVLTGAHDAITEIAWSPDDATLAAIADDGTLIAWRVSDGAPLFASKQRSVMFGLAFFPSGDRLIAVGEDLGVRMWDRNGQLISERTDPDIPFSIDLDRTGTRALSAAGRQRGKIYDPITGATLAWLDGHVGQLIDAAWSPDGRLVATASLDGTARVWDVASGRLLETVTLARPVWGARFAPDGKKLVIVDRSEHGDVAIYDLPTLQAAAVARATRCLPYTWRGERPEPRARDHARCE